MDNLTDRAQVEARRRYADRAEMSLTPGAVRNAREEAFEKGAAWGAQQAACDHERAARDLARMTPYTLTDAAAALAALTAAMSETHP